MPHLTLEYTTNLDHFAPEAALAGLNQAMLDSALFGESDIKSRAVAVSTYKVGTADAARAFIHIRCALLAGRSDEQRCQAWIDRQLGKVEAAVLAISRDLGDKPYCMGVHLSLADVAVGAALGYLDFRFPELSWREQYPNLVRLQDKLMQRASFMDTQPA